LRGAQGRLIDHLHNTQLVGLQLHLPGPTMCVYYNAQGRLIDHLRNTQLVGLEDLQALVLDEADRLLSMGFTDEVAFCLELGRCLKLLIPKFSWKGAPELLGLTEADHLLSMGFHACCPRTR